MYIYVSFMIYFAPVGYIDGIEPRKEGSVAFPNSALISSATVFGLARESKKGFSN